MLTDYWLSSFMNLISLKPQMFSAKTLIHLLTNNEGRERRVITLAYILTKEC